MQRASKAAAGPAKPPPPRASVVGAYREGLGLAGIAIVCEAAGACVVAIIGPSDADPNSDTSIQIRWWCRRAADAERVAAAAALRIRRLGLRGGGASSSPRLVDDSSVFSSACDAVLAASRRLNVLLQSDDEVADEAALVAARVRAEMQKLQQSGGLKSVNQAYRDYRIEATARGERIVRYAEWMRKYEENLVRQAACALRHI